MPFPSRSQGSERNDLLSPGISWRQRIERLLFTAVQGFVICLLTFWWYWPISIAIVAPIYEHRSLAGTFIPAIIKLVYGGVLSLLTNPIMALLAMGAESSVRRGYPELEVWREFGGDEDFDAWLGEQGLTHSDVEIGPNGIARRVAGGHRDKSAGQQETGRVGASTAPAPALPSSSTASTPTAADTSATPGGTKKGTEGAVTPATVGEGQTTTDAEPPRNPNA